MNSKEILRRIEEIEARAARATPGPWEWRQSDLGKRCKAYLWPHTDDERLVLWPISGWPKEPCEAAIEVSSADADFIAHARTDVPLLCQIVRQLVARLEEVEAQCAAMREALEEISYTEPDEKPDGTILGYLVHDAYEMSEIADAALKNDAGRELLDRFRKLESAAQLALQALTEGMADVPAERDSRCAALRVKAKRALREALDLAPEEENDGDL